MKIYGSNQYIENPQVGDLELEVNSMWDFKSRSVCFKSIPKSFGGGEENISYNLRECIEVTGSFVIGSNPPKPCKNTKWQDAEVTPEISEQLISDGYTLAKALKDNK